MNILDNSVNLFTPTLSLPARLDWVQIPKRGYKEIN